MNVVLTLCSANYLAHAKTLGDSLREHNADFHFVIGLVDRMPKELDANYCDPFEVLPVEDLRLPQFAEMAKNYNIVELNTAVKPFYMAFLYERDPSVKAVIYLDPDILVCGSFEPLLERLKRNSIVVTPHGCTYDNSVINIHCEKKMLSNGIYNLGFIATSRSEETFAFLKWWQVRLQDYCYYRPGVAGSFFDQLWVNLAPLYFHGIYVETDPGYNMCHWNHFERNLRPCNGGYLVNNQHKLIFFHFSGYKPENPDVMASRIKEPAYLSSFNERRDLRPIYDNYGSRLLARQYFKVSSLPCQFMPPVGTQANLLKSSIKNALRKSVRFLPHWVKSSLRRSAQFVAQNC